MYFVTSALSHFLDAITYRVIQELRIQQGILVGFKVLIDIMRLLQNTHQPNKQKLTREARA